MRLSQEPCDVEEVREEEETVHRGYFMHDQFSLGRGESVATRWQMVCCYTVLQQCMLRV